MDYNTIGGTHHKTRHGAQIDWSPEARPQFSTPTKLFENLTQV